MGFRKNILTTLTITMASLSLFAQQTISVDMQINSPEDVRQFQRDVPVVYNLFGHEVGKEIVIDLRDLHTDAGPNMHFQVDVVGTGFGFYDIFNDGDLYVTIPAERVTEQLVIQVKDVNRTIAAPGSQQWWPPALGSIQFLQEIISTPELVVETRDHHLGNPSIYVFMVNVKNVGSIKVRDLKVRYYFTTENISTCPIIFDYYTPKSSPKLLRVPGTKEFALEWDFDGVELDPGSQTLESVENQVHIYYPGYASIDKFNDYSNPIPESLKYLPSSVLYKVNNKVAVYDKQDRLIHGNEKPGYSKDQFIAQ